MSSNNYSVTDFASDSDQMRQIINNTELQKETDQFQLFIKLFIF